MMRRNRFARYFLIILWASWAMLCVRFGFKIGLFGPGSGSGSITTVLFALVYGTFIPLSLLLTDQRRITTLLWIAISFAAAGMAALLIVSQSDMYIASVLLAAASALFTALFLYVYTYGLSRREQIVLIVAFMVAKTVSSFMALFISDHLERSWYMLFAATVLAGFVVCTKFLAGNVLLVHAAEQPPLEAPFLTLTGIYILFSLVTFERMNCVFTLYAKGGLSPAPYYLYFTGGLIAALAAWWLFVHRKCSIMLSFNVFIFTAILHIVLAMASQNGIIELNDIDQAFFGISDIVYVFLFVTAASISKFYPSKKIFMGFVFVFGFGVMCAFGCSYFLYVRFPETNLLIFALTSLVMISLSFLLLPLLENINQIIAPESRKDDGVEGIPELSMELTIETESSRQWKISQDTKISPLTTREKEIVDLLLQGYSNHQISGILHIALSTVKVHNRNIYDKLQIRSRLELLLLYQDKHKKIK